MSIHFNQNNTVKKVKSIYANIEGAVKKIKSVWVDDNGTPKRVYSSSPENLMVFARVYFSEIKNSNLYLYSEDGENWYAVNEYIMFPDRPVYTPGDVRNIMYGGAPIFYHGYFITCGFDYLNNYSSYSDARFYILISEDCIDFQILHEETFYTHSGSFENAKCAIKLVDDKIIGFYTDNTKANMQFELFWDNQNSQFAITKNAVGVLNEDASNTGQVPILYPQHDYKINSSERDYTTKTENEIKIARRNSNSKSATGEPVKFMNKWVRMQDKCLYQSGTYPAQWINNSGFLVSDNPYGEYTEYSSTALATPNYSLGSCFGKVTIGGTEYLIMLWADGYDMCLAFCDSLNANDIDYVKYNGNKVKAIEFVSGTTGSSGVTGSVNYFNIFNIGGRSFVYFKTTTGYVLDGYHSVENEKTYELEISSGKVVVKREITTPIHSCVQFKGNTYISNGNTIMKVTNFNQDADFTLTQACPNSVPLHDKNGPVGSSVTISNSVFEGTYKSE